MKLDRVTLREVVVPVREGAVHSECYGAARWDQTRKVILEAATDEGIVGFGEAKRGVTPAKIAAQLSRLRNVDLTTVNLQDPMLVSLEEDALWSNEWCTGSSWLQELSLNHVDHWGVHSLLLDLLGKRLDVPAYVLLGGAYRKHVRVDAWAGRMTAADTARACRRFQSLGYRGVKMKCSIGDADDAVGRARAIRDACGVGFKITWDPNERFYRPAEAIPLIRRLVEVSDTNCIEDPFPADRLDWHRELRALHLAPVALTLEYGPRAMEAASSGACDYANVKGVPADARKTADLCWAAGIPCWLGTGIELGILEAAYLHLAAATKAVTRPCDLFGRLIRSHDLLREPFRLGDGGMFAVPEGPGLGIDVDRQALDSYTVAKNELRF